MLIGYVITTIIMSCDIAVIVIYLIKKPMIMFMNFWHQGNLQ